MIKLPEVQKITRFGGQIAMNRTLIELPVELYDAWLDLLETDAFDSEGYLDLTLCRKARVGMNSIRGLIREGVLQEASSGVYRKVQDVDVARNVYRGKDIEEKEGDAEGEDDDDSQPAKTEWNPKIQLEELEPLDREVFELAVRLSDKHGSQSGRIHKGELFASTLSSGKRVTKEDLDRVSGLLDFRVTGSNCFVPLAYRDTAKGKKLRASMETTKVPACQLTEKPCYTDKEIQEEYKRLHALALENPKYHVNCLETPKNLLSYYEKLEWLRPTGYGKHEVPPEYRGFYPWEEPVMGLEEIGAFIQQTGSDRVVFMKKHPAGKRAVWKAIKIGLVTRSGTTNRLVLEEEQKLLLQQAAKREPGNDPFEEDDEVPWVPTVPLETLSTREKWVLKLCRENASSVIGRINWSALHRKGVKVEELYDLAGKLRFRTEWGKVYLPKELWIKKGD